MPYKATLSALALGLLALPALAGAAWNPPGVDLTRPRILFRAGDEPLLQARAEREPYVSVLKSMRGRTNGANGVALDDHSIEAERFKSRAAKNLSFLYAIDRTLVGGDVVPFPTAADRAAVGQRVHDLLLNMYPRHRVAVPPPLGGWDRDISSSEELLQYATAYDTMLGAGWEFGADQATIERHIVDLASEMYENFVDPDSVGGATLLHQNNHRSKSGAAMVVAAIAVAEFTPEPGSDPRNVREPTLWLEYGLDQVDLIMRHVLVTGDGAYGEGPFYLRFASQNLIPFGRAWDRLVGGAVWNARGVEVPSLWRHPLWLRTQRWMLDMTLPDGSMAAIDDGNPGRSHYFGILPPGLPWSGAFAWRWYNAPQAIDTDGNIDLGADAIALFDDTVPAGPPSGPTTAFYFAGGNAIFRSDWSSDAVLANVQAEHDVASEFGRDRDGLGVQPQSHEHAEPGAFLMHAFGERLAIDPGYLSFPERTLVNQPQHHNVILVDGKGPGDYLSASFRWANDLAGPPPADGQGYLSGALDGAFLDAATVRTTYGLPPQREAQIERRFLFADDRYLVIADEVASPGGPARSYGWLLHGNGGGTSGGTFEATAHGGRWTRPLARLDSAIALDTATPSFAVSTGLHEAPGKVRTTHTVLNASATGDRLHSVQLVYPTRSTDAAPEVEQLALADTAALVLDDAAGDRRVLALHRGSSAPLTVAAAASGLAEAATDGVRALFDAHLDGTLRFAWAERATFLRYAGIEHLRAAAPGLLGIALSDGRADVVADTGEDAIAVHGLPFRPLAADGACALADDGTVATIGLSRERRVTLRAAAGNSAPAADPGPDRFVALGAHVVLDAGASCDLDGDPLTPSWELVEAPVGADWAVDGAATATPSFVAATRGAYRWRLTVADAHGATSLARDLVVRAVAPSEDQDGDLVPSDVDNCASVANADQGDAFPTGGNGVGDACECTDGACAPGGGPAASDCALELRSLGGATVDGRKLRCPDGAGCDADPTPGLCGFDVVLCLGNQDAARPACTSFAPREVHLRHWRERATPALLDALAALPGGASDGRTRVAFAPPLATRNVCTAPIRLTIPVPGRALGVATRGPERRDVDADRFRFVCER
jgi:hypothetical protein